MGRQDWTTAVASDGPGRLGLLPGLQPGRHAPGRRDGDRRTLGLGHPDLEGAPVPSRHGDPLHEIRPLAFSPDGRSLVRGTWTQRLELLDTITWKPIQSLRGQTAWSLGAWTPDGRRFVSPSLDGNLRIWDPSSGSPLLLTLPLPPGPLTGMGIPPGGHYLILVLDGRIHAWATKP